MASRHRQVESDRFQAKGEKTGAIYTVVEYQTIIETPLIDGGVSRVKGTRSLRLSDGRDVNWLDEETFKIVRTDEVIRKI